MEKVKQQDKEVQIRAFYSQVEPLLVAEDIKIGTKLKAEVSLVKDYGAIVAPEKYPGLTGFILLEQIEGEVKEGQVIEAIVMDMDFEKEIIDLSHKMAKLTGGKMAAKVSTAAPLKNGQQYRARVELNKEDYLLISFKSHPNQLGLVMT